MLKVKDGVDAEDYIREKYGDDVEWGELNNVVDERVGIRTRAMKSTQASTQFWAALDGSLTLFDFKTGDEDVEEYVENTWGGDCDWGMLTDFTDMRARK